MNIYLCELLIHFNFQEDAKGIQEKASRQSSNIEQFDAVRLVSDEKKSRSDVAAFKISKSSLGRAVTKYKASRDRGSILFKFNLVCGMVFTAEDEVLLERIFAEGKQ